MSVRTSRPLYDFFYMPLFLPHGALDFERRLGEKICDFVKAKAFWGSPHPTDEMLEFAYKNDYLLFHYYCSIDDDDVIVELFSNSSALKLIHDYMTEQKAE